VWAWRGEAGAEGGHDGEFLFVGGVDHDGADARADQIGDDGSVMRDEGVELEVEVGVVERRHRKDEMPTEHTEGKPPERLNVFFGEGADGGTGAGEAVAAGGAEVSCEVEGFEGIGVEGGNVGGRGVAVEITEKGDEAANEGSVGFAAEVAVAVTDFADEVDERDAAADAVGVSALGVSEEREFFRAVDDYAEAFLRIIDDGEVGGELSEFFGEGHGEK
jgi:hypothetical protein